MAAEEDLLPVTMYPWLGACTTDRTPALYHWSPRDRREGILQRGVRVGRLSVDGDWRPPHTCWAEDPMWAWHLSGAMRQDLTDSAGETMVWDLWWCWLGEGWRVRRLRHWPDAVPPGREGQAVPSNNPARWCEWRIFDDLPKGAVKWLASRPGGLTMHRNPPADFPRPSTIDYL